MFSQSKSQNKKLIFIFSLIIIILGYFLYSNWTTSTNLYMKSRSDLEIHTSIVRFEIISYLENKNQEHLTRADRAAFAAAKSAEVFHYYYPNPLGNQLANNFEEIFYIWDVNNSYILTGDVQFLDEKVSELNVLLEALGRGSNDMSYGGGINSIIPKNPYTKARTKELLQVTNEILSKRN